MAKSAKTVCFFSCRFKSCALIICMPSQNNVDARNEVNWEKDALKDLIKKTEAKGLAYRKGLIARTENHCDRKKLVRFICFFTFCTFPICPVLSCFVGFCENRCNSKSLNPAWRRWSMCIWVAWYFFGAPKPGLLFFTVAFFLMCSSERAKWNSWYSPWKGRAKAFWGEWGNTDANRWAHSGNQQKEKTRS